MSRTRFATLGLALALVLAACGGGGSDDASDGDGGGGGGGGGACPVNALDRATGTVAITMWHGLNRANEETLQRITQQYNASQSKVAVTLVNQTGYKETLQKFRTGLSTGDLPDITQIEDTGLQQMIDTQAVIPIQDCVDAEDYELDDYIPRVIDYYTVEDTLWPMPFNVSNPVLYFDRNAFTAANLDPNDPPSTLDEVAEYSAKIKQAGAGYEYGYGLKLDPWYIEQMSAKGGIPFVNNGNGRDARATATVFDNKTGLEIFTWMKDMVDDGLAVTNEAQGPSQFDNLLGIRSKKVGMTIDSSASLGTISQVLASGEGGGVSLGVGPMPGPSGDGGVLVGGAALYISKGSAPEKQAAAWDFLKYLTSPEIQAEFAAGTGYVPIRESSIELPAIKDLWAREPGYKVAYDQLTTGVNNVATAGPVIGDYQGVRDSILAAEQEMFTEGLSPQQALTKAARSADQKIEDYNSRVG
jgi:sn-glycerol 3-phosphate transport system substrate-binding protein